MLKTIFSFLLLFDFIQRTFQGTLTPHSNNPINAYAANKGTITFYQFVFSAESQVESNAYIQVIFPSEFNLFNFITPLSCSLKLTTDKEYAILPCEYKTGNVVSVTVGAIVIGSMDLVIGLIQNPSTVTQTSFFRIYTLYGNVVVDRNEVFGYVSFGQIPDQILNPIVQVLTNTRISEGSTWQFSFTPSKIHSGTNSLRFNFPDGFITNSALCDVSDYFGDNPISYVYHNKRVIKCTNVQKTLNKNVRQVVKLVNMVNPAFSGLFRGFMIEIMDGDSSIVSEQISFDGNQTILPGILQPSYYSDNMFKFSNTIYGFYINLVNKVNTQGRLYINFTSDWILLEQNCSLLNGFNADPNLGQVRCQRIENQNSYMIDNFQYIDSSVRLTVAAYLGTPKVQGTYQVTIGTYNTIKNSFIDYNNLSIAINQTFGTDDLFRAHPMNPPVRLKAGETGALELIFFLKNNLPYTNVGTMGLVRIEIFPPIKYPSSNSGVLSCYFYGNVRSNKCTFELVPADAPIKTLIYVQTPPNYNFQQSEIPITITTDGPLAGYNAGITLDPLIKRYIFHLHMFNCSCDLPNNQPTEVYFTEYVPQYFPIPSADIDAVTLIQNMNEFTYLVLDYTHNDLNTWEDSFYGFQRNYVFRIEFPNNTQAWDDGLGWPLNNLMIGFPCAVSGTMARNSRKIRCDLNTFVQTNYPFIQIYGLDTKDFNTKPLTLRVEIPKIKLRNLPNQVGQIIFKILEETPGMQSHYIELYRAVINNVVTTQAVTIGQTSTTNQILTLSDTIVNRQTTHTYDISGLVPTGYNYLIYEYQDNIFQGIKSQSNITCGASGQICSVYASPVNQIFVYSTLSNIVLPSGVIQNSPHEYQPQYTVKRIGPLNTVTDQLSFKGLITPDNIPVANILFQLSSEEDPAKLYALTEHKFSLQFTLTNPVPDNWGFEIAFTNINLQSSQYFYGEIDDNITLTRFDYRGVLYNVNLVANKLQVYNLNKSAAGSVITLQLKLKTTEGTSADPSAIFSTYNESQFSYRIDVSSVAACGTINFISQSFNIFRILQPVQFDNQPGAGYIGPFNALFIPKNSNPSRIQLTFQQDFATPNGLKNAMYCELNGLRSPCIQQSSNPLNILITRPEGVQISNSINNSILISTEFSTTNGLLFPSQGNYYQIDLDLFTVSVSNTIGLQPLEKYTDFVFINPHDFGSLNILSELKSIGQFNIFTVEFQVKKQVPSFAAGGRIQIEFPTQDDQSLLFDADLGYTGMPSGTPVGCWFDPSLDITSSDSNPVSCVLVTSKVQGSAAFVEVINFAQLPAKSNARFKIAKIKNPNLERIDCNIGVNIYYRNITSGEYSYIHYQTFRVFLDLKTSTANADITHPYAGGSTLAFDPSTAKVDDLGVKLKLQMFYSTSGFQIEDIWITEVPKHFIMSVGNIVQCDSALYTFCIYFHDIRWAVWKLKASVAMNTYQNNYLSIFQMPLSVPITAVTFDSYVYQNKLFVGIVKQTINTAVWNTLISSFTGMSVAVVKNTNLLVQNRKQVGIIASFTTTTQIKNGGTILIKFASSITNIYPHCRSSVQSGSKLVSSESTTIPLGEVGCLVQNSNSWAITGFKTLGTNQLVKIFGYIDMPSDGSMSTGDIYVVSYTNTATDIFTTGFPTSIGNLGSLPVQISQTLNIKPEMTLTNTQTLKANYVGPFQTNIVFAQDVTSDVTFMFYRNHNHDTVGTGTGFQDQSSESGNFVCYFVLLSDDTTVSCQTTYSIVGTGINQYAQVVMKPFTTLTAGQTYLAVINVISTSTVSASQGVKWPTTPGLYKVSMSASGGTVLQNLYFEVFGPQFSSSTYIRGCINAEKEWNLIEVFVQPSVSILTTEMLVIELPTKSIENINLFDSDAGTNLLDYTAMTIDIVNSSSITMVCRFFNGNQALSQPAKIICSQFSKLFTTSDYVRFFFTVTNPDITTNNDYFIPIVMYSVGKTNQEKSNYQLFPKSVMVRDGDQTINQDSNAYQFDSTQIRVAAIFKIYSAHLLQLSSGFNFQDYYILRFNFALQKSSGIYSNGYSYNGLVQQGTVIILFNLRIMILLPNAVTAQNPGQIALASSIWNNPLYFLAQDSERVITGYTSYHKTRYNEKSFYNIMLPTFNAIQDGGISVSVQPINGNYETGQDDDYKFFITATDFDKINRVVVRIPSQFSMSENYADCILSKESQIDITQCYIQTSIYNDLWIFINRKSSYGTGSLQLVVETRGLAITNNPDPTNLVIGYFQFVVRLYSWTPELPFTPSINTTSSVSESYNYRFDNALLTGSYNFVNNKNAPSLGSENVDVIYERYDEESGHFNNNEQFAPITFDIMFPVQTFSLSNANQFHEVNIRYPDNMDVQGSTTYAGDLLRFKPYCLINQVHRTCTIDPVLKNIKILFSDFHSATPGITSNMMNVRASMIDQTDSLKRDGFRWISNDGLGQFIITISVNNNNGVFTNYTTVSETQSLHLNTGGLKIDNWIENFQMGTIGNTFQSSINIISLFFTIKYQGINWLAIDIFTQDDMQNKIYTNSSMHGLNNGEQFPCTFGQNLLFTNDSVICVYKTGQIDSQYFGRVMRIFVTNFAYNVNLQAELKLLIINPDVVGQRFRVAIRGYGGGDPNVIFSGQQYYGWSYIENGFVTLSNVNTYLTTTDSVIEFSAPLGKVVNITIDTIYFLTSNTYSFIKIPIYDSSIGQQICNVQNIDRTLVMYMKEKNNIAAYITIKNLQTIITPGSKKLSVFGAQCDQYGDPTKWRVVHLFALNSAGKRLVQEIIPPFSSAKIDNAALNPFSATTAMAFVNYYNSRNTSAASNIWGIYEFNQSTLVAQKFTLDNWGIMAYRFTNNSFLADNTGYTNCYILSGPKNTLNPFQPVLCTIERATVTNIQQVVISNFDTVQGDGQNLRILVQYSTMTAAPTTPPTFYTPKWVMWKNLAAKTAFSSIVGSGQQMGFCQTIKMNYYGFNTLTAAATVTFSNLNLVNGVSFYCDVTINPNSATGINPSGNTTIDILFKNIPQLNLNGVSCTGRLTGTGGDVYQASAATFDCNMAKQGVQLTKFNLANLAQGSPIQWSNQAYTWRITLTLGGNTIFSDPFIWFNVRVTNVLAGPPVTTTVRVNQDADTNFNTPLSSSDIQASSLSITRGSVTEIQFTISSILQSMTVDRALYLDFVDADWPIEIVRGTNVTNDHFQINCKCSISGSTLADAKCYRHNTIASKFQNSISVHEIVSIGQSLQCYIPYVVLPTTASGNWNIEFKLVNPSHAISRNNGILSALYLQKITSPLSSGGLNNFAPLTITSSITYGERIGDTISNYNLQIGGIADTPGQFVPFVIIYFGDAGPVPNSNLCSINMQSCRIYTQGSYIMLFQYTNQISKTLISIAGSVTMISQITADTTLTVTVDILNQGNWQYSQRYTVTNNLQPLSGIQAAIQVNPAGTNIANFQSVYTFSAATGFLIIPSNGALVIDIPSSVGITSISPYCLATVKNSIQIVVCSAQNPSGNQRSIVIQPYLQSIAANSIVYIILGFVNPSNDITFTFNSYSFYQSLTNFYKVAFATGVSAINKNYSTSTLFQNNMLKMYSWNPKMMWDGNNVVFTPIRFFMYIPVTTVLPIGTNIQVQLPTYFSLNSAIANNVPICSFRLISLSWGQHSHQHGFSSCTYDTATGIFVLQQPVLSNFLSARKYMIILSSSSSSSPGWNNPPSNYNLAITVYDFDGQLILRYYNRMQYMYQGNKQIILNKFYYTTDSSSSTQLLNINLQFQIVPALSSSFVFPRSFLEIEFPQMTLATAFPNYVGGQEIPCGMAGTFQNISTSDFPPKCIVTTLSVGRGSYLVIRVERFNAFVSNSSFILSIDNMYIRAATTNAHFDFTMNFYVDNGTHKLKYSQPFKSVFLIETAAQSAITQGSAATFNALANTQVSFGPISYTVPNVMPLSSTNTASDLGSKICLNFGTTSGLMVVNNNINTIGLSDSLGNTLSMLWYNEKSERACFQSSAATSGNTVTYSINNLYNPNSWLKQYYGISPIVMVEFYQNFKLKAQSNWALPSNTTFTPRTSGLSILTTTTNVDSSPFVANQYVRLQIGVSFSPLTNQDMKNNWINTLQITFTAGVVALDNCYFIQNLANSYTTCQIKNTLTISYSGIQDCDIQSTNLQTFVYAKLSSQTITASIQLNNFDSSVNQIVTQTKTLTSTLSATSILPTSLSFLNNRYLSSYYEMQTQQIKTAQNLDKLQFQFTTQTALTSSQFFQVTLQDAAFFTPSTISTDGNFNLISTWTPVIGTSKLGLPLYAQNTMFTTPNYKIFPPRILVAAGTSYVVEVAVDFWGLGYNLPILTPTSVYQMHEFVLSMMGSSTQSDVLQYQVSDSFTSATIIHKSLSVSQYDFIDFNFQVPYAIQAAGATDDVFLEITLSSQYYGNDAGLQALYSQVVNTGFNNGNSMLFTLTPSNTQSKLIGFYGQWSQKKAPVKFVLAFSTAIISQQGVYNLRIPFITNPSQAGASLTAEIAIKFYKSGDDFGSTLMKYSFINHIQTVGNTINNMDTVINVVQGVQAQSSNVNFTLNFQNWGGVLLATDILILKWDSSLSGIEFSNLINFDIAQYAFNVQFYPQINIFLLSPSSTITSTILNLSLKRYFFANDYISNYGFAYTKIISGLKTVYQDLSIPQVTLQAVSDVTNKVLQHYKGYDNVGSQTWVNMSFVAPKLVEGGIIYISLPSQLQGSPNIGSFCRPGYNIQRAINFPLECYKINSTTYALEGFRNQSAGLTISIHFFFTQVGLSTSIMLPKVDIYGTKSVNQAIVQTTNIGTISTTSGTCVNYYQTNLIYVAYVYAYEWGPLQLEFQLRLRNHEMINLNGDFLTINLPTSNVLAQENTFYLQSGPQTLQKVKYRLIIAKAFVDSPFTYTQPSIKAPPADGFNIGNSTIYNMIINTEQNDTSNGVYRPGPGMYSFSIESRLAASGLAEISFYDFILEPRPDNNFKVNPFLTGTSLFNILQIQYYNSQPILVGDVLSLDFTTYDFLDQVFDEDLGLGFATDQTSGEIDCQEEPGKYLIADKRPRCYVFKGNKASQVPLPAVLKMTFEKNIPLNQTIIFYIAFIKNPAVLEKVCSINLKINRKCRQDGYLCPVMQSSAHFVTTQGSPITNVSTQATNNLITATGQVLFLNQVHTFKVYMSQNLFTNDWILIKYGKDNHRLSETCTGGNKCIAFVLNKMILYQPSTTLTANSFQTFTVGGVANGWFAQGQNFQYQFWRSDFTIIFASESPGTIYTLYQSPNNITFNVTQTSTQYALPLAYTYFLQGYNNIYEINIQGIWINGDIKQFWLYKPASVAYFDSTYCNATLTIAEADRLPYPLRFYCQAFTDKMRIDFTTAFSGIEGWKAPFNTYSIKIYLKGFINLNVGVSVTDTWLVYGLVVPFGSFDLKKAVSVTLGTHGISQEQLPDLNDISFNTKSFEKRKARIGDKVEIYMILKPKTLYSFKRINKIIFRLPDEFSYPPIQVLDGCSFIGSPSVPLTGCNLDRIKKKTLISTIPVPAYKHQIQIVTLRSLTDAYLFPAPSLPGSFYNISVELYCDNTQMLCEKNTINMSRVLGYELDINYLLVDSPKDDSSVGIYSFKFRIGTYSVPAGYIQSATTIIWSRIRVTFDNYLGFENDLGSGLQNVTEIGCVPKISSTFTVNFNKRLTCVLYIGKDQQNPPYILVTGYDALPANAEIQFFITNIKSLPLGIQKTVQIGVEFVYTNLQNAYSYFYEPAQYIVTLTTASAMQAGQAATVVIVGSTEVLGFSNYTFTFTPNLDLKTTDFFVIQFPNNFFQKLNDYSVVVCAQCAEFYIFTISNLIYMKPINQVNAGTQTSFEIKNMLNPSFQSSGNIQFKGWTLINHKIDSVLTFTTPRAIGPCSMFSSISVVMDSSNGGENDVTYSITFKTGHQVKPDGAIAVFFPSQFTDSLVEMGVTCALAGFPTNSPATCKIGSSKRVDIYLIDQILDISAFYTLKILGVNNPNVDTSQYQFQIVSFFDSNIYLDKRICQAYFPYPKIIISPLGLCNIFVSNQYKNTQIQSQYSFQFTCSSVIRENTNFEIFFPSNYKETNPSFSQKVCSSQEATTLASESCIFQVRPDGLLSLKGQLRYIESQSSFSILTFVNNPTTPSVNAGSSYSFYANFSKKGIFFAAALPGTNLQQTVQIINDISLIVENTKKIDLFLTNIPKNAGARSTYVFSIPPRPIPEQSSINQIEISFPNSYRNFAPKTFSYEIGSNIQCGVYATTSSDTSFLTYKGLLQITQGSVPDPNYVKVPCSITVERVISISGLQSITFNMTTNWFHWIINNVNNPSAYNPGEFFTLAYQNNKVVKWMVSKDFLYLISDAPQGLQQTNLSLSNKFIKNRALYNFSLLQSTQIPQNPQLGISIILPKIYSNVISIPNTYTCKYYVNGQEFQSPYCNSYSYEILIENVNLKSFKTNVLSVALDSIYNPALESDCSTVIYYEIRLIDLFLGDMMSSTSASALNNNCLKFQKASFKSQVIGAQNLFPGLSYIYTIILEQPGSGLVITPTASVAAIKFDPVQIFFDSFTQTQQTFKVKVRSDIIQGQYIISFDKKENRTIGQVEDFYEPLLPLQVNVINAASQVAPTITIQDISVDTIGYPIFVPITLSQEPSNLIQFEISIVEQNIDSILSISPKVIQLDSSSLTSNFSITILANTVPDTITLKFSLSSFYPIVHVLSPQTKYIVFSRSGQSNQQTPPMHISLQNTYQATSASDLGKTVNNQIQSTTYDPTLEAAVILSTNVLAVTSNTASFKIFISDFATFYYCVSYFGNQAPTSPQIVSQNHSQCLKYGQSNTVQNITQKNIDYIVQIFIDNLQGQTNYILFMTLINPMGISRVQQVSFKTTILNFGSIVRLPFLAMVSQADLIRVLSTTLRATEERFKLLTDTSAIQSEVDTFNQKSSLMIKPNLYYDVVIIPNKSNDNPSPTYYANQLQLLATRKFFKNLMPEFDTSLDIQITEIRQTSPSISEPPTIKSLNFYNVTYKMLLNTKGTFYGILQELSLVTVQPTSIQIQKGADTSNKLLGNYKYYKIMSKDNGQLEIFFDDLKDNTAYVIWMTIGNYLPYEPLMLYEDNQVMKIQFTTDANINVASSASALDSPLINQQLNSIKSVNPALEKAIRNQMQEPTIFNTL